MIGFNLIYDSVNDGCLTINYINLMRDTTSVLKRSAAAAEDLSRIDTCLNLLKKSKFEHVFVRDWLPAAAVDLSAAKS